MTKSIRAALCLGCCGMAACTALTSPLMAQETPRLVLQITVDQLRGDMIGRFGAGLGPDGFNRLLDGGLHFAQAHHRHANTETIVGHATLATGADPAVHGMVANIWFDRVAGEQFYNVQDPDFTLVGAEGIDAETEIDPTQRAATTDGRSPRNILTSTIADEIGMFFGPEAKVFGVSVKDRGAISMAGHGGQAYWFSKSEGRFVTSTFYRDDYPDWIDRWHATGKVGSYAGTSWQLNDEPGTYLFGDRDDQYWETAMPGFGRTFPHDWGQADSPYYTTFLTLSPAGDEITADFAKALIDGEGIGTDDVTDYLAVSFSSTDYVGHLFGPSSLEAEDNMRRLDRTLADFLTFIDERVGLDQTLVVLSADHGAPENPFYLAEQGMDVGAFSFERVDTEPGFVRLTEAFGDSRALIRNFSNPYIYLDREVMAERGLDPAEVEDAIAAELDGLPGIAYAVSSRRLREGLIGDGKVVSAVRNNFHRDRSGDIYVVFEPHWFIADFEGLTVASAHGSPWAYDTHVPVIFHGPGVPQGRVARHVETIDVAPTISAYLGTKPPSGATGVPLPEVFE